MNHLQNATASVEQLSISRSDPSIVELYNQQQALQMLLYLSSLNYRLNAKKTISYDG